MALEFREFTAGEFSPMAKIVLDRDAISGVFASPWLESLDQAIRELAPNAGLWRVRLEAI
jgi:hypothetical protein